MTEIPSLDDAASSESRFDSPLPLGEKLGRAALAGVIVLSGCSFLPTRKKKAASLAQKISSVPQPNPAPVDESFELPLPVKMNQESSKPTYASLHCTPEDRKKIGWIITTVDQGGIDLLWKKEKLDAVGEEILPVHPYKFLSTILLDPVLKNCLRRIFKDPFPFKRKGFLGGVKRGMERESGNLENYIHEFAGEMGTTADAIRPLMQAGDWSALVIHLLEKEPKRMHRTFQA